MGDQGPRERHLVLLKWGVETWNVFRRDHSDYIVLNGVSMADAQLAKIDLHSIVLMESDFRRANLAFATLERSVLRKSDFRGSDLRCANLDRADLCRADLSGADLRGASLTSAFLKRTNLTGADLSTARGLTSEQINDAYGDDRTRLPEDVARPAGWENALRTSRASG
jgi:uncharacterized protein YjbI with pentapeptide repeats